MPVAIRAATRIQDMDDINVTLGAGVDEYSLVYDNDTAKFVLRAPVTGYLLATGAVVGATSQAQNFTVGVTVGSVTAPATLLQVAETSTASPRGIMSSQHSTGTDGARFHMRKSRGTNAAPVVVVTGDVLGRLVASGYDGSNYLEMGGIDIVSAGTIASTRVPTEIRFLTATDAAPSVLTQRMVIDKAGNVGIGTAAPLRTLHVYYPTPEIGYSQIYVEGNQGGWGAGISFASKLNYSPNTVTAQAKIVADGTGNWGSAGQVSSKLTFWTVNANSLTEKMVINAAGDIGIGTTSPATALHVVGAATITAGIRPAANSTTALQLQNATGTSILNVDTTNSRVGIGTTSPVNSALHVVGGGAGVIRADGADNNTSTTVGTAARIMFVNSDATTANRGALEFWNGAISKMYGTMGIIYANRTGGAETGDYYFSLCNAGTVAEVLRIKGSGNVGISTTSPETRLDIDAGALTMKEMTAPTGVADKAMLYTKDNGSGKTQLCCKLGDNVEIVIATQA